MQVTTAITAIRAAGARAKLDQTCADAVDLARDAVTEDVAGPYIEAVAEGERLVTHYFECLMPGYRGWRWAVTVARVPRSKHVTVCETVLLPGPDALVAPPWVPWEERVAPGDLGVGDLMPTPVDDERLAPGYLLSDDPAVEDVVWELGLGRVRVMSREGRLDTADRWYDGDHGPHAPIATAAPSGARCVSCGFYLPLGRRHAGDLWRVRQHVRPRRRPDRLRRPWLWCPLRGAARPARRDRGGADHLRRRRGRSGGRRGRARRPSPRPIPPPSPSPAPSRHPPPKRLRNPSALNHRSQPSLQKTPRKTSPRKSHRMPRPTPTTSTQPPRRTLRSAPTMRTPIPRTRNRPPYHVTPKARADRQDG